MSLYSYDPPERFVAGTVGQPGERTFYLQASASGRVTSVALEKFQVSLLAERLEELLDEVLRRTGGLTSVPAATPSDLNDDEPLDLPLMEDFRVGAIALAWDGEDERVVIEAQEESATPVEPLAEDIPENGGGTAGPHHRGLCAGFFPACVAHPGAGPASLPAVRPAARHRGAHLPAPEWPPSRQWLISRPPAGCPGPVPRAVPSSPRMITRLRSSCSARENWRSRDA
jgi:uncharacterized repeat protein (TIGR03847 family)